MDIKRYCPQAVLQAPGSREMRREAGGGTRPDHLEQLKSNPAVTHHRRGSKLNVVLRSDLPQRTVDVLNLRESVSDLGLEPVDHANEHVRADGPK